MPKCEHPGEDEVGHGLVHGRLPADDEPHVPVDREEAAMLRRPTVLVRLTCHRALIGPARPVKGAF